MAKTNKALRLIIATVLAILGIALVVILGRIAVGIIITSWKGLLFYGYLVPGIIITIPVIRTIVVHNKGGTQPEFSRELFTSIASTAVSNKKWYTRFRDALAFMFLPLVTITCWPLWVALGIWGKRQTVAPGSLQFGARSALQSHETAVAGFTFIVVAAVLLFESLRSANAGTGYSLIFLILVLTQTFLRHLSYTCRAQPLPTALRRTTEHPYLNFAALVALDFFTLCFCLIAWQDGKFDQASVLSTSRDLVMLTKAKAVLMAKDLHPPSFAEALASVIFYITLLKTLLKVKEFKRTDDDYNQIAHKHALLGKYNQALALLDKVSQPDETTYLVRGACYLGVRELSKATEFLKKHLDRLEQDSSEESVFVAMNGVYATFPFSKAAGESLIDEGIQRGLEDLSLATTVDLVCSLDKQSDDVVSKFQDPQIGNRYLFSTVIALMHAERFEEAAALVESFDATRPFMALAKSSLSIQTTILQSDLPIEEDAKMFAEWLETSLPIIGESISSLQSDLECAVAANQVQMLALFCKTLQPERSEELVYQLNRLRNRIKNPIVRAVLDEFHSRLASTFQ